MNRAELSRQSTECGATARFGTEGHGRIANERSAALLSENQSLVTELTERALNSHELHAKFLGEFTSGWELVSRRVLAIGTRDLFTELPRKRMADFAHLCAQLDAATGLGALSAYRASLDDLNDDVIEGDLLAQTVIEHAASMQAGAEERMTSTQWLHCLSRLYAGEDMRALPKGWPTTGKVLSDRLKRLQPTLAARGVIIDSGRTKEGRYIEVTRLAPPSHEQERAF